MRRAPNAMKRSGPLVPSSAQRRLLFVDRLRGGRSAEYVRSAAVRLTGPLDRTALLRAIQTIVERHEVLRTYFTEVDGEPVQVIADGWRPPIAIEDLSGSSEEQRDEALRGALLQENDRPFDLFTSPPLRFRLLAFGPDEHVFVRTVHHIAFDVWSRAIWNSELESLYAAYRRGDTCPLPALPVQYADYARWEHDALRDGGMADGLAYWSAQLARVRDARMLPTDRARPRQPPMDAATVHGRIPPETVRTLRAFGRVHRKTLYMSLLAALAIVIARHTGGVEVAVGTPVAARSDPRLERLIGLFVNTLLLRLEVAPTLTVGALLDHVQSVALEAYRYQHVPFERAIERAWAQRGPDAPLPFQVLFAFVNVPAREPALDGLRAAPVPPVGERAACDLAVYLRERDGAVDCEWQYRTALFDRWRIAQLARHYEVVASALAARAGDAVGDIPLMDPAERDAMLELSIGAAVDEDCDAGRGAAASGA